MLTEHVKVKLGKSHKFEGHDLSGFSATLKGPERGVSF